MFILLCIQYCYKIFNLTGLQAEEIHLCGEAGAIGLIEEICNTTGEEMDVSVT